ncbi:MAG: hypothetical protein AAB540_04065, partial [Patescibacteria group bacterium]
ELRDVLRMCDCDTLYGSNFCQDCTNCDDIHFSYDLRRCKNCFGCVGLRNKKYHIFNKPLSKQKYEQEIKKLYSDKAEIFEKLEELKLEIPRMYVHQHDTTDCTGDYIYHSKNCHQCFDTRHTEDSGYIYQANLDMGTKDSWDCGPIPTGMDLCYDIAYSHYLFNGKHLYWCGNVKDSEWCINCMECEHLFGCYYLKNKQKGFYILNKKVDEDYYWETSEAIKKDLLENGIYTLYDLVNKDLTKGKKDEKNRRILDDETERDCFICGDHFNIVPAEIEFYKKLKIAWPVYCPNCRFGQRFNLRNERKMYKRICDACKKSLISTYTPDSEYVVYCLKCWHEHMG